MANGSKIVITAGLQVPETVHNIQNELDKQVAPNLKLEIACNINSDSLAAIQEQISKLSEGLTINLNNANIRQAKVEIIPDIKKGVLEDQAKRLEKELGLSFSYGNTTKLREELMGLLNSYQKAYQAEGAYGEQAEAHMQKIIDFARQYQQENVLINETLKAEQERIKEIRAEQQKVFITADQMNTISREARRQGTSAQAILNSQLPNGWYSDPNKIPAGSKPYYWSDYVDEINHINPFHQIVSSENDILQAMSDISAFMSKSFITIDDSIEKNENELRMWVETVKGAVGDVTGKNPYSDFFDSFVDLIPDEEVNKIKQESQTIQNSISGISSSMQSLSGGTGADMRMSINAQAIDEFISELNKLGVQGVNLDELRSRFENLDISIDKISSSFSKLDNRTEYLSQVTIKGKDTFGSLVDYTEKYEYSIEEAQTKFSSATTKITENFERIRAAEEKMRAETDTAQKSLNKFLTLQGKFDFFAKQHGNVSSLEPQFAEISELISKFDNTAPIENQQEAIIRLDNALKLLKIDIDEINRANGEATVTSQEALDAMTAKQLHLRQQYEKLEASITKAGLSMDAIATRDGINYRTIFTDIIDGAVTSTAQLKRASDALTTIRNEFQIANAQTVSTLPQTAIENFAANVIKLRTQFRSLSTDYSDIKDKSVELSGKFNELTEAIKPFENFDKATIDSKERLKELVAAFTNARTLLVEVKAETANVIKEQTKQEAEYKKLTSSLNEYIAALEKFNNSSVAKSNTSNIAVSSQLGLNTNLAEQLRAFQESLANDKSPENVNRIRQRIDELSSSLEAARWNSSYLIESLENSNADAKLTSQIRNLTNQVEAYANANKEAVESQRKMRSGVTFADEFQRIINTLKNGNLDNNAIRRLKEDFTNFKGEARSIGLTTNRLFTNMGNQLKMLVSRWLSLYAVIGKIRTMINYVIQLDDAMTKLKRVTDETAAGYEQFLEVAKKSAKETNTTLVDTVEQAAKWAKSGYDAATSAELAKTSLIYSIVGDIDNDTAVSDLVTALRGFRLEAEDAISVVDKLDALNNKYATDAKSLGEGLRVSASAMAAANNDIDQTLALLTGATEITQNAQETGQAIKTITMRLRGMKGELQKLGEDAEGVESISKIQTQILNLTKGRVNIFDANGNFRATYDILKDISEVYNELSDPDKANLTEIIFGKLRSNQGLAIISAFQSGQIQKALKDSQNSAGTATEEMVRYSESITAHINQFKEAVQELSSDAIDADVVKNVVDQGKELVNLLDHLITSIEKLKEVANFNGLIELYDKIRESPVYNILNPLKGFLDWVNQGNDIYADLFGEKDDITQGMAELSDNINSASLSYIQYYSAGRNADDISVKLATTIDGINEKYADNKEKIDLTNKSMAENLSLMRQIERQKLGDWLSENADEYGKAVDELNKVGYTNVNFLRKEWLDGLELPNLTNKSSRQEVTGTDQERLDSLIKIKDAVSGLNDVRQRDLDQLDAEIKKLESNIEKNKAFVDSLEAIREKYNSLSGASAQSYNMIEQAAVAYQQYQESVASGDREGTKTAFTALNNIKEIVYSMTDTNSVLRQDFNDLWATFVFGATEGMSKVEEVRADFAELSGEAFDNELKNIESISKAIDSMLNDETLSHEDAWKLLNLDTEGVLSDIQLINGQYKLSTDQLVALMEQQINKQKESIETVKAAAQAEYDLLQAQLRRLKVNSPSDVAAYKLEVERITDEMRDMQDVIFGSDLLLQEVNGILGKTYSITGSIATGLSNAVKQFEAEVEAIDDAIDSLNDRKEVLQDEKSILQNQLDALNEQKKTIEDTLATYDKVGEAVDELVKAQVDGIQAQIDALEEERKSIEDYYEEQLDALKEQNEERDDAIEKEEALANLANAQNQKKRVYSSDRGWDYEASKADILKAQNELAKIANNEQIKTLENERDAKLAGYDERKKEYETQIKEYEDYASKYTSISADIKNAENELLAAQILGSDWREKIEQKDEGLLTNYRAQYTSFNEQLNNLTNNEIATLQASIDAKDAEIKKIDDEIAAYNKYKKSVEKSLNDAKTALENYKNSMNDAKAGIISASNEMENSVYNNAVKMQQWMKDTENVTWENHNKIIQWYSEIGDAAEELQKKLRESPTGFGIVNSAWDAHLAGYADGGVNTSTGIAMLHGTKQKGEVIFNASDSKKLYDMIHGTPNLLADVVKQANKITGFSPVNSTNTNSVSVSIGQIVANNPQEFTRGLDVELDKYFRRKLTESYVQ